MGGGGGSSGWGGGGGGGGSTGPSADDLARRATSEAERGTYDAETNAYLQDLLADYNNRDQEKIQQHLATMEDALSKENIGSCTLFFGGSIKKHTYIDGLSDVDVLAEISETELADKSPSEVLLYFAQRLRERLPNTEIKVGRLAVTVTFSDGHEIQILPAIKKPSGVRLSTSKGDKWSNVIRPEKFAEKLTSVNKANNNGVVPVIKLFKAINATLPEDSQLSGYHIESIAINAFRNYQGGTSRKEMLMHLTLEASEAVLEPIEDKTGQSIHVDDKLGPSRSLERQRANMQFKRFYNKMQLADSRTSVRGWKELFGDEP
jgi:hypothetical protein